MICSDKSTISGRLRGVIRERCLDSSEEMPGEGMSFLCLETRTCGTPMSGAEAAVLPPRGEPPRTLREDGAERDGQEPLSLPALLSHC